MSDYKSIIGKPLKFVTANLDNDQAEGQIWYNSTTGEFKDVIINQAWASAANVIVARRTPGGTGAVTTGLACGGGNPSPALVSTEEYNGSGWSIGEDLGTGRYAGSAAGDQTSGLYFGGATSGNVEKSDTEEYDGSSWTAGGALSQARQRGGGAGTQTAGLYFGGSEYVPTTNHFTVTEEYNGTSWTSGGSLNTAMRSMAGFGIQTAALSACGNEPTVSISEEYDGSSWTSGNNANTARVGLSGSGIQTSGLIFGGSTSGSSPGNVTSCESYDGTSFTNIPSLATARRIGGGAGANSSEAIYFAGFTTTDISLTEEFTRSTNVITGAAWASGGAYPISVFSAKFVGDKDAGLGFAGYNNKTDTCEYNGSSWTNVPALPAGGGFGLGYAGTQTAGLAWHGYSGTFGAGGFNPTTAYEYNGSSWASGGATPFQGRDSAGFGIQTAAIGAGGYTQTPTQPPTGVGVRTANTISYDGSTWTNVNSMNTARELVGGFGVQTAGVVFGGQAPPANNLTEDWDGTNWTASNTMNIGRRNVGGFGTQTEGYAVGGRAPNYPSPNSNFVEEYNGSSWVTSSNLATGRSSIAVASNLAGPGQSGSSPYAPLIEEFTPEATALNVKTISTS